MRKLVMFALPFGAAAAVYVYVLPTWLGLALCALAGLVSMLFWPGKRRRHRYVAIGALGLAAGFLWCAGYDLMTRLPQQTEEKVTLSATVRDYPDQTSYGCRVTVLADIQGKTAKTMVYLPQEYMYLAPGDHLQVKARLSATVTAGGEDDRLYYAAKGIRCIASGAEEVQAAPCDKRPWWSLPVVFGQKLRSLLSQGLPEDVAPFFHALLTGDTSALSDSDRSDLSTAGLSHVVAVSGMHISILLGTVYFFVGRRQRTAAFVGIPLMLLFVLMTGCSPSAVRAAVMQSLLMLAPVFRRESDGPTSLCTALLLLVGQNPWVVASVSFQLSFGATAGIVLFSQRLYRRLSPKRTKEQRTSIPWRVWRLVAASVSMTLGALVFTLPIAALTFGTVSIYSLLANLLVFWAISVCFVSGMVVSLAAWVYLPLGKLLGLAGALPVRYVLWVAGCLARLPFAALAVTSLLVKLWLLGVYLSLLCLALCRERKPVFFAIGCAAVSLAATMIYLRLDSQVEQFQFTALDVGQGQCIVLRSGAYSLVIDCGGSNGAQAGQTAASYLQLSGDDVVEALVLTHFDEDHINGVEQLLRRVEVETVYLPDVQDSAGNREKVEALAYEAGAKICYVNQDVTLTIPGGQAQIFAPQEQGDDNASCLSALCTIDDFDALITGDMDIQAELTLLHTHTLPQLELLVAGHHGSKYASGQTFLSRLAPQIVWISVGENNSYGHPSEDTLLRLTEIGAKVYRTDQCGTITIRR